MTETGPATEGRFDADYLYFFADALDDRSDAETDLIWDVAGLDAGMEVLDLACGHGRIANRLAQRGCRVTGLDSTDLFLQHARRDAEARGVTVEYVHGDMRQLPWSRRFDRIINWFTAFGYFDDLENRQVLIQAADALRLGGRLAMEMNNLVRMARGFPTSTVVERNGDLVVDQHRLDPLTCRSYVTRNIIRDGRIRQIPFFVRLFTFPELHEWLRSAGFTSVSGYGEDGNPLNADHHRMITVAGR